MIVVAVIDACRFPKVAFYIKVPSNVPQVVLCSSREPFTLNSVGGFLVFPIPKSVVIDDKISDVAVVQERVDSEIDMRCCL